MTKKIRFTRANVKTFTLKPDNKRFTGGELSRMFGVPQGSLSRIKLETGKTVYTREELEQWGEKVKAKRNAGLKGNSIPAKVIAPENNAELERKEIRNINDVVYKPSLIEKALASL